MIPSRLNPTDFDQIIAVSESSPTEPLAWLFPRSLSMKGTCQFELILRSHVQYAKVIMLHKTHIEIYSKQGHLSPGQNKMNVRRKMGRKH